MWRIFLADSFVLILVRDPFFVLISVHCEQESFNSSQSFLTYITSFIIGNIFEIKIAY